MSFIPHLRKHSRLVSGLLSSFGLLVLAVWGWDVSLWTLLSYLVVCLAALAVIAALAALLAFFFNQIKK